MLPPAHRLTRPDDFRRVFSQGVSAGGSHLVLHAEYTDEPGLYVGFIASKKVGNAVQRHRVKRQLRHLVRE
ncbi:MAG: ribonuclease P protein component, partial [Bowdeniella nasicola]|nr:ribonuclease P protein component [Bowdeniella nasicola]